MSRKWYKHKNGNSFFYSPEPSYKAFRDVVGDGSKHGTPKEIEDLFKLHEEPANMSMGGVYFFSKEDKSTATDLPSGTYVYCGEDYPLPARLVPVDFRTDKYIEMSDITDKILIDVNNFLANEKIYRELNICYKTACLLFGPGGTGKTALIRYIVAHKLPSDSVTIAITDRLPGVDFLATIRETLATRIKFFILEEFTHFVKDPFDCEAILTFLDGENSVDKSICFASTNYPEVLPANIVSRHSRIEFMYEIGIPNAAARKSLMSYYLKREVTAAEVGMTDKMTADSIKALCLLTWTKKLSFEAAKNEVEKHLNLSKRFFKGKEAKIGF